jgi:putative ABC transport system permease protein
MRVAGGNTLARPGRTVGLTTQAAAAVSAVLIVASLGTSLADFGEAELEPWRYEQMTYVVNPGDGFQVSAGTDADATAHGEEAGLFSYGSHDDFEIDVYGLLAGTEVIDTTTVEGRWFESPAAASGAPEAVVTEGFARHRGISVGDLVEIELPSGPAEVEIVGTHRLRRAAFFLDRAELGDMLGRPATADVVWAMEGSGPLGEAVAAGFAVEVDSPADLVAEDTAARGMIMGIFWAIGIVVAAVATIGFASSLQMLVHDRRRELAAVRAGGGSAGLLRRLVLTEATWVALVGGTVGAVAAHFGASALMAFVESSESMDIGYSYAMAMVAPVLAAALLVASVLAVLAVRPVLRTAPATLLRAAD